MNIARCLPVVGSLYALLRNKLGLNVATPLGAQELSCTVAPDRRLVVLGHEPIAGFSCDLGTVADEAAMLALHTLDSTTLLTGPTFVAPGDSCLRTDDPGWRWHCIAGHGAALADWERRPLAGALDGKQPAADNLTTLAGVASTAVGRATLALATPAADTMLVAHADGTVTTEDMPSEAVDLPIASATTLGGIKVGSGLSIDSATGVLAITSGGFALAIVIPFLSVDWMSGYSVGNAATLDGGVSWAAAGEVVRYAYPGEATDRMDYTPGSYDSLTGGSVTGWAIEESGWAGPGTVEIYT